MRVKIVNVDVENVVKGKSRYSKATVTYLYNGEARTQSVMSFTNPQVFKTVQESVGQEVEVTVEKNDAGYNQWTAIGSPGNSTSSSAPVVAPASSSAPPARGGYSGETPAERASRQVYIVKQSSLANAIALSEANKAKSSPEEVIAVAQQFTDWVLGVPAKDTSLESLQSDLG